MQSWGCLTVQACSSSLAYRVSGGKGFWHLWRVLITSCQPLLFSRGSGPLHSSWYVYDCEILPESIYIGSAVPANSAVLSLPLCEHKWLPPNHNREESPALFSFFRPSWPRLGSATRYLNSVAKENKFTLTWSNLFGNKLLSTHLLNPDD